MKAGRVVLAVVLVTTVAGCSNSTRTTWKTRADAKSSGKKQPAVVETTTPAPQPSGTVAAEPESYMRPVTTVYVNVVIANIRDVPSKSGKILAKARFLERLTVTGHNEGEWTEVELNTTAGTRRAWIHNTLVSTTEDQAQAAMDASDD